jgi:hypothetical protein
MSAEDSIVSALDYHAWGGNAPSHAALEMCDGEIGRNGMDFLDYYDPIGVIGVVEC